MTAIKIPPLVLPLSFSFLSLGGLAGVFESNPRPHTISPSLRQNRRDVIPAV
jgi:hypothetical protein